MNNLEKYKNDITNLIKTGEMLRISMQIECDPTVLDDLPKETSEIISKYPKFRSVYQTWYSEALAIIKFLLPDRVNDFKQYYEKPKVRKSLDHGTYTIQDYLQGLINGYVKADAAIPLFEQQFQILKSCEKRFESSLFDIRQLLQADIFDSELESAKELNKKGFTRGAGAMTGVILEAHFSEICHKHNLKMTKKHPTINDYNDLLKNENIIAIDIFRHIQLLGDLRNKCDHKKDTDPTKQEIDDLISGTEKIIKTVF